MHLLFWELRDPQPLSMSLIGDGRASRVGKEGEKRDGEWRGDRHGVGGRSGWGKQVHVASSSYSR